ncbi:hypothetical protein [Nocardia sp. IFM 10818]
MGRATPLLTDLAEIHKDNERRRDEAEKILKRADEDFRRVKSIYAVAGSPDFEENFEAAYLNFTAVAIHRLATERFDNLVTACLRSRAALWEQRRNQAPEQPGSKA